jgi:hypothetical protein
VAFFLAGLPFRVEPGERLTQAEREALLSLADPGPVEERGDDRAFRIELERGTAVRAAAPSAARISWSQGLCRLDHAAFRAEIEPFRKQARVVTADVSALGLVTTLRVALACWLPLEGGLVLHAAGLERGRAGIAFHGASGAGKTTLAGCSPWPVLSDELVALVPDGSGTFRLRGTPFRKRPAGAVAPVSPEPRLHALVELEKGPAFELARVDRKPAFRKLLDSAAVPAIPPVWNEALSAIGRLSREVPCYRMAWSPADPPFGALAEALGL